MDNRHSDHLLVGGCLADYCDILGCKGSPEAACSPYTDMTLVKYRCHGIFHKCLPPDKFPNANQRFVKYCDGLTCNSSEGRIVAPRPWETTKATSVTVRHILMAMVGGILVLMLIIIFFFRWHAYMPKDLQPRSVCGQRGGVFRWRRKAKQG